MEKLQDFVNWRAAVGDSTSALPVKKEEIKI